MTGHLRTTTAKQAKAGKPPRRQRQKGGRCTTNHFLRIQLVLATIALAGILDLAGILFWQEPRLQKITESVKGLEEGLNSPTTKKNNRNLAIASPDDPNIVQSNTIATTSSNTTVIDVVVPFVPWKQRMNRELPCIIDTDQEKGWKAMDSYPQKQPSDSGLLYIKIEKAASTTLASVAARTAIAIAKQTHANTTKPNGTNAQAICRFRGFSHLWSTRTTTPFSKRNHLETFLWTFLKDPTKQALSMYLFFHIDWGQNEFGMESFREFMGGKGVFQAQKIGKTNLKEAFPELINKRGTISNHPRIKLHNNHTILNNFVKTVISDMDFIGIVERLDESLVLLSFMLDVKVTDVLYTSSKVSGGYMTKEGRKKSCLRIGNPRPLTPEMQAFLDSPEYKELMKIDQALYDAVNKSIDATIETVIGRDIFDKRMREYLEAKQTVHEHCSNKIVLACDANGTFVPKRSRSECYNSDIGCGHRCLDEIFPVGEG